MTRGKYAAKANGQRAEAAANTVVALRGQLDQERREHAAAVSALKAEILSLQGQLLREVRSLAASEVERVRAEAREAIEGERTSWRATAEKIALVVTSDDVRVTTEAFMELATLLGYESGEFLELATPGRSRNARRTSKADIKHGFDLLRQQQSLPLVAASRVRGN